MSVIVKIRAGQPYGKGAVSLIGGTRYIVDESGAIPDSQIEDQSNLLNDNFKNNVQILGGTADEVIEALLPDQVGHSGEFLSTDGEFVSWLPASGTGGVSSFNTRTGAIVLTGTDVTTALTFSPAPLVSPTFTGTPAAPTAISSTNTTQIATTAFVQSVISSLVNSAPSTLDTLKELADALGDDANFATTITNSLALKAPLSSPTFTGTVITPAIRVTTSPTTGYVLTSDVSGNATWQAIPAAGTPTLISNGGGSVSINGSGAISITPASGQDIATGNLCASTDGTTQLGYTTGGTLKRFVANLYSLSVNRSSVAAAGYIQVGIGNTAIHIASNASVGVRLGGTNPVCWASDPDSVAADLFLFRDAANTLAQRNGVNPQTFRLYNTFTDVSNGEWLDVGWSGGFCYISTNKNGTGALQELILRSAGNLYLRPSTNSGWRITSSALLAETDNSYDIGASGATRPRNLYLGTQLILANGSSGTPSTGFASEAGMGFYRVASGELLFVSGGSPMLDLTTTNVTLPAGSMLKWGSAGVASGDVCLSRDAANTLAQRRGTNAQVFRVYNTYTDSSNGEWGFLRWTGAANTFEIGTLANGTGTIRNISITGGNLVASSDGAISIGLNGSLRPYLYPYGIDVGSGAGAQPAIFRLGQTTNGIQLQNGTIQLGSTSNLSWSSGSPYSVACDTYLYRDAANTLGQRNGVNAQAFRLYNTYTDASNGEWGALRWNTNVLEIGTYANGSGTVRNISLAGGSFLFTSDNTADIGASGANRPRTGYFGTNLVMGGSLRSAFSTPTTLAADQNNYTLPAGRNIRLDNSAAVNITGAVATVDGDERQIINVGPNNITLKHQSASSTSTNRFQCIGGADIVLAQHDSTFLIYDATSGYWRVY
jgi:hypothetical protein